MLNKINNVGYHYDESVPVRGTKSFQRWLKRHRILVKELEIGLERILDEREYEELGILEALRRSWLT